MKKHEILEGNKLIAQFMGYITNREKQLPDVWWKFTGVSYMPVFDNAEQMKYHSDFNELEKVIEKIQFTDRSNLILSVITNPTVSGRWISHTFKIERVTGLFDPTETIVKASSKYEDNESKISTVFRGIVEFIKKYDERKES